MNNNRGFTLVEVLASIMLLGVIVTSIFQFFIFSQKTTIDNQDKLVAINISQRVLQQIKEDAGKPDGTGNDQYWQITHPTDHNYVKTYPDTDFKEIGNGKTYSIKIDVTEEKSGSGLYMIAVSVLGSNGSSDSTVKGLVEL